MRVKVTSADTKKVLEIEIEKMDTSDLEETI
jgi:hypothetical protein